MTSTFWRVSYHTLGNAIRATWRVRITGREHLPRTGPAIIASNHLSFLDHFILPLATPRQIFFISKAEHFDNPLKRFFFRNWGVIPLKRGASDQDAFERSVQVLREGELFGIYPEGTRSLDGKLHRGRTGVARLAAMTHVPVIPAAMVGTFEAMPKGRNVPRLNKLGVRIGPPLDTTPWHDRHNDRAAMRELTDLIMRRIAEVSGQEYVDQYQFNPEYAAKEAPARAGASAPDEAHP